MTEAFEKMLYLLRDGTRGNASETDIGEDIEEIRKIALKHSVWQTVFLALPEDCKPAFFGEVMQSVSKNIQRNAFVLNIIDRLKKEGIEVTLIKGMSVSRLYKEPDMRISGDTDILIDPKKESATKRILEKCGFTVYNREEHSHHFLAVHPVGGLLEVHISLYDKSARRFLFYSDSQLEERLEFECYGKKVKTLGITDGLQFLFIHYVRHLVSEGVGVRQLMDLLLYMEYFKDEIDNDKLEKALNEFHYKKLMTTLKAIGNKYLGFNFENAEYDEVAEKLLNDIDSGGTFGTKENADFYKQFLEKRAEAIDVKDNGYHIKRKLIKVWGKIFPSSFVMRNCGYSYAKNVPLLMLAYLHRFLNIILSLFKKKKASVKPTETKDLDNRMSLMRELEII